MGRDADVDISRGLRGTSCVHVSKKAISIRLSRAERSRAELTAPCSPPMAAAAAAAGAAATVFSSGRRIPPGTRAAAVSPRAEAPGKYRGRVVPASTRSSF